MKLGMLCVGLTLALIACTTLPASSQAVPVDRRVAFADSLVLDLQRRLPALPADSIDLMEMSSEGGTAITYREASGAPVLVRTTLYGESGSTQEDLYFSSGLLVLDVAESSAYNVPFYIGDSLAKELGSEPFDPAKTKTTHARYYFANGSMIHAVVDGTPLALRTAAAVERERSISEYSAAVLRAVARP